MQESYTFGPFRLEPARHLLTRDGEPIPLTPKAFDLLLLLVRERERVVPKEEALRLLWPDTAVEEGNLTQNVFTVRKALGDSSEGARFVATIPRRGYRFVAEVREVPTTTPLPEAPPPETPARQPEPPRRRSRWLPAAVLGGLALLYGVYRLGQITAEPQLPALQRLTFRRGLVNSARFAPDGRSVVYTGAWDGQPERLFLVRPESPESQALEVPEGRLLSVSKGGELAMLLRAPQSAVPVMGTGTLARVPLTGGPAREVLDNVVTADFAPDGSLAVVRIVDKTSKRIEFPIGRVLHTVHPADCLGDVRVSPRGDMLAFGDCKNPGTRIVVLDREGKRLLELPVSGWIGGLAWSGDEVWFTTSSGGLYPQLRATSLSGRERLVARLPGNLGDVGPEGRVLTGIGSLRAGILGVAPGETEERELGWLEGSAARDLSADGTLMLFGEVLEGGGPRGRIYLRTTDGQKPAVLLGEGIPGGLSPDGKQAVLYARDGNRRPRLLVAPTGPGEPREVATGELDVYQARFFPDGKRLLLGAEETGHAGRLWVADPGRPGPPRPITPEMTGVGEVSPDGRTVVAVGHDGLHVYPVDGGQRTPVPGAQDEDWPLQWSPDGRAVYVHHPGLLPRRVFRIDLATGERTLWKELMPRDAAGISAVDPVISRDGRAYAYSYLRRLEDLYLATGVR